MRKEIIDRLAALRNAMKKLDVQAYIIPSSDPHLSEYVPECWKAREWISGFDGSAGTVVVTLDKAGLWTDSRYFLQGAQQLEGTTIDLFKQGLPATPSITQFLRKEAGIKRVGFCGRAISVNEASTYARELKVAGIEVVTDADLVAEVRAQEAPGIPGNPFFIQPIEYAGQTAQEKVAAVRAQLLDAGVNTLIITMLDEIAWLFNVRGTDVDYNPVGIAYALITKDSVNFYAIPAKLNDEVSKHLISNGVTIKPYEDIYKDIAALTEQDILLVDPARTTYALASAVPACCTVVHQLSPITLLKACKNEAEYKGYCAAMRRDGVALTRFFMWLESELNAGKTPDEVEVGDVLTSFRAKGDYYVSDSFATIAGYNGHGAIVHYRAARPSAYKLEKKGILLLDSGGQYKDGTTDITRTVSLDGKPTRQQQEDYTRVLKGHIDLAMAVYPQGTRGSQLDILARKALWDNCQNYGHGTGHGVGHFLNVHEGPQNIRMDENPTTLRLGMVTSNEPGYYLADQYGIRIENLVRTILHRSTPEGDYYGFETLTLCYLDNALVAVDLLTDAQLQWYNDYQERVYQELSPALDTDEKAWLRAHTAPLTK